MASFYHSKTVNDFNDYFTYLTSYPRVALARMQICFTLLYEMLRALAIYEYVTYRRLLQSGVRVLKASITMVYFNLVCFSYFDNYMYSSGTTSDLKGSWWLLGGLGGCWVGLVGQEYQLTSSYQLNHMYNNSHRGFGILGFSGSQSLI